jgi:hypothetical protein
MAALSITAGNVVGGVGISQLNGFAGEAITAGQPCYCASDTGLYMKAKDDTAAHAAAVGIALNGAALNQPLFLCTAGPLTIGATVSAGTVYYVGDTAGDITASDVGTGEYVTVLGVATSASVINIKINVSGVAKAA